MSAAKQFNPDTFQINQSDLHPHLRARMVQRGITIEEMQQVLRRGWKASDCRPGTVGKTLVLSYLADWEGEYYEEKEITVYYKVKASQIVLLTVKARYGKGFPGG
jgi:hypothetical protein